MKPAPFAYVRAQALDDVFRVLDDCGDGARILAGGQSLMATLNMRLSAPEVLVDIGRVEGLAGIEDTGGHLRIGAMTRHVDVETSALVAVHAPLIASAMPHVAHPAIRNRGTFGGSIAFADPAAELPALRGSAPGANDDRREGRYPDGGRGRILPGPVRDGRGPG